MIRDDEFILAHRAYAVDLTSLRLTEDRGQFGPFWRGTIDAVWFRRRPSATVAYIGTLWDYQHERPADATAFLQAHDDGQYGGNCDGRYDGQSYWGNGTPDVRQQHLAVLRPMLDAYPAIPDGFDGWWRF